MLNIIPEEGDTLIPHVRVNHQCLAKVDVQSQLAKPVNNILAARLTVLPACKVEKAVIAVGPAKERPSSRISMSGLDRMRQVPGDKQLIKTLTEH